MAIGYQPIKIIDDDGSAHFAKIEVEYQTIQDAWKQAHPNTVWIIDVISDTLVYINSDPNSIYPIKRFKTQKAAENWLTNQGADYLTRCDYEWMKARKKLIA